MNSSPRELTLRDHFRNRCAHRASIAGLPRIFDLDQQDESIRVGRMEPVGDADCGVAVGERAFEETDE